MADEPKEPKHPTDPTPKPAAPVPPVVPIPPDVQSASGQPAEVGGPKGPEPTRYGDWEKKGIAVDF